MDYTDDQLREITEQARKSSGVKAHPASPIGAAETRTLHCGQCGKKFEGHPVIARTLQEWHCDECKSGWPKCPICGERSREPLDASSGLECCKECVGKILAKKERAERRTAAVNDNPARYLAECNVPPKYRGATIDGLPDLPAKLKDAATRWAETQWGMGVLIGVPGSGKSFMASAIIHEMIVGGMDTRDLMFVGEHEYLAAIKGGYDGQATRLRDRSPEDLQMHVGFVVIDDLGASRLTDWAISELAWLIESRYAHELQTLVTTNLTLQDIGEKIDPRISSRLADGNNVWRMPAKDLRIAGSLAGR